MTPKINILLVSCLKYLFMAVFFQFLISSSYAAPQQKAVLQGLDKVTARVSTFEAELNSPVKFGAMNITIRHCDRTPPHEAPESRAFIEIIEEFESRPSQKIFSGWMFSSSPALSAVEHPVYDIWVLECKS